MPVQPRAGAPRRLRLHAPTHPAAHPLRTPAALARTAPFDQDRPWPGPPWCIECPALRRAPPAPPGRAPRPASVSCGRALRPGLAIRPNVHAGARRGAAPAAAPGPLSAHSGAPSSRPRGPAPRGPFLFRRPPSCFASRWRAPSRPPRRPAPVSRACAAFPLAPPPAPARAPRAAGSPPPSSTKIPRAASSLRLLARGKALPAGSNSPKAPSVYQLVARSRGGSGQARGCRRTLQL
jgi:hypothetical protein